VYFLYDLKIPLQVENWALYWCPYTYTDTIPKTDILIIQIFVVHFYLKISLLNAKEALHGKDELFYST
jgi:hypothetical protein